jgi:hypothetical protein
MAEVEKVEDLKQLWCPAELRCTVRVPIFPAKTLAASGANPNQ